MFRSMGFVRGDKVAINMMNRPEYTCILLGLSKIGVAVPLINYNLTQQSLLHCIEVADVKGLIYEESLESSVSWLYERLSENLKTMTFCIGEKGGNVGRNLESEMKDFPDTAPPPPTGAQSDGGLRDRLEMRDTLFISPSLSARVHFCFPFASREAQNCLSLASRMASTVMTQ